MPVFRIKKTKDYTVMSNHHLRNKGLSLKAKGLLSQMLSLPEDWDFTLSGLSTINLESISAIRTAVAELEKEGYVIRKQSRDMDGKMAHIEYFIYENPVLENPMLGNPTLGNRTQLSKDIQNKDLSSTYQSIYPFAEEQKSVASGQLDHKMD